MSIENVHLPKIVIVSQAHYLQIERNLTPRYQKVDNLSLGILQFCSLVFIHGSCDRVVTLMTPLIESQCFKHTHSIEALSPGYVLSTSVFQRYADQPNLLDDCVVLHLKA